MTTFLDRPISPQQVKLVQIARRAAGIAEADYRTLLRSIGGGVESTKDLTQGPFERLMAYLESAGFVDQVHGAGHWNNVYEQRAMGWKKGLASARQCRKLHELAAESVYDLAGMCRRMSHGAADAPEGLTAAQAHELIEAFKDSTDRNERKAQRAARRESSLYGQSHGQSPVRLGPPPTGGEPMTEEEVPF